MDEKIELGDNVYSNWNDGAKGVVVAVVEDGCITFLNDAVMENHSDYAETVLGDEDDFLVLLDRGGVIYAYQGDGDIYKEGV